MSPEARGRIAVFLGVVLLAVPVVLVSCSRPSRPRAEPPTREGPLVRVRLSGPAFSVRIRGGYAASDGSGWTDHGAALDGAASADASGLRVGGRLFPIPALRLSPVQDGALEVNGVAYHGDLLLKAEGGKVTALNLVRLEPYLAGVLGAEAVKGWPEATLKAQAVAARTYAVVRCEACAAEPFDLTDDVMDQCYQGRLKETEETRRMVDETAGEVLTYRRRPFVAYYCSVCGGQTGDVVRALNREPWIPPLAGRPCPYCEKGLPKEKQQFFRWTKSVPRGDLEKALEIPSPLLSVAPAGLVAGQHSAFVHLAWEGGAKDLDMLLFRQKAGLISNAWEARMDGPRVVFEGRGFGHGVGMCQWGAKRMGEEGFDHREILRFYYPGADLQRYY